LREYIKMTVHNAARQNQTSKSTALPNNSQTSNCGSKIKEIFRKTFGCGPTLEDKEIEIVKEFRKKSIHAFQKNAIKNSPVIPDNVGFKPKLANESLEGVRDFAHAIVDLTVNCIQDRYVKTQITTFNDAAKDFPETLKKFTNMVLSVGAQTLAPIFALFKEFDQDKAADSKAHNALQLLLNESKYNAAKYSPEDFRNLLKENKVEFKELLRKNMDSKDPAWEVCADEFIHWLFITDHKQAPFASLKVRPPQELIDKIGNESMLILIDDKIDAYGKKVGQILNNKLPGIIEKSIKDNALKITELLSTRVADVIEKMGDEQFTVLSDKMVEIAGNHFSIVSKSHEEAERTANEHAALVAYAEEFVSKNVKDDELLNRCKEYLKNVKAKGGIERIKEDTLLRTFLTLTGNNVPSKDNTISEGISRLIIDTLLPPITNKEGKQVNGLENLLSTIELPKEFKELLEEASHIAKQLLGDDQYKDFIDLSNIAIEFKDLALEGCAELIKLGLGEAIDIGFKKISKPDELNLLLMGAMPDALESMYKFFGDDLIQANLEYLAPLFQKLPNDKIEEDILNFLLKEAKKAAPTFHWEGKEEQAFLKKVKPRIAEITELLAEVKDKGPANDKYSKPKTTIALLKEFFSNEASEDNNHHFAKFIDASLGTGEFGSFLPSAFKIGFIRNMITKMITGSVQTLRKSYRPGLNSALPTLADKFIKKEVIDSWIDYRPSIESLEDDIKNLGKEITDTDNQIKQLEPNFKKDSEVLKPRIVKKEKLLIKRKDRCDKLRSELESYKESLKSQDKKSKAYASIEDNIMSLEIKIGKKQKAYDRTKNSFEKLEKELNILEEKYKKYSTELNGKLEKLKKNLTESESLKEKISKENEAHAQELLDAQQKMPGQVEKISNLAYDMILYKTEKKGPCLAKFALKKILGPNADKIQRVVLTLFNNIFGREIFNRHLMDRITLTSVMALNQTSSADGNAKPLLQKNNQIDLSNLHAPISAESYNNALKTTPFAVVVKAKPDEKPPVWKRILNFVINIFRAFFDLFKCKKSNLDRQMQLMHSVKPPKPVAKQTTKTDLENLQETKNLTLDDVELEIEEPVIKEEKLEIDIPQKVVSPLSPTLEKVGQFVSEFTTMMSGVIITDKIQPLTAKIRKIADDLPHHLETILNFLNKAITPLATTIVGNISRKGYKVDLDEPSQGILNLLFKSINKTDLKELKKHLKESNPTPYESELSLYIDPIVNWIWIYKACDSPKEIKSLGEMTTEYKEFSRDTKYDENMTRLYIITIQWLVIYKIQNHSKDLQYFLQNDLDVLISSDLKHNMQSLSRLLFNQVAQKLNHLTDEDYKKFFDESAGIINKQMINIIQAEKNERNDKEKAAPLNASSENKAFQDIVNKMINLVFPKGNAAREVDAFAIILDNIHLDTSVKNTIEDLRLFIKSLIPARFSSTFEAYEQKIIKSSKEIALNSIHHYAKKLLAEKLKDSFKLFVETQKRQELLIDKFPVVNEQLAIAFAALILSKEKEAEVFEYLIKETAEENSALKENLFTKYLLTRCKEKFTNSWEKIKINRENLISEVKNKFAKHFFNKPISDNLKIVIPLLKPLLDQPRDPGAKELNAISTSLIETVRNKYNWKTILKNDPSRKIETECFKTHINPIIFDMVEELNEKQRIKQLHEPSAKLTDEEIEKALKLYFGGEKEDKEGVYVDMLCNVMKMGEARGNVFVDKFMQFFKTTISDIIVPTMHPVRGSFRNVMELAVQALRALYLDKNYITNMLNQPTLKKTEEIKGKSSDVNNNNNAIAKKDLNQNNGLTLEQATEKKFKDQLQIFSYLMFDLIHESTVLHMPVFTNPEGLYNIIETVDKKLFKQDALFKDMLIQITNNALDLVDSKGK
jgi:hypothetical protein